MAKHVLIGGFVFSFLISLFIFFFRDASSVRENMERNPGRWQSRIALKDFVVRHFKQSEEIKYYQAEQGLFTKDNYVELRNLFAFEKASSGNKKLRANQAKFFFTEADLAGVLENPKIQKAILSGNICLEQDNYLLFTEKAYYNADLAMVFGSDPVRFKDYNHTLSGKNGFQFNLNNSEIRVFGRIEGIFAPDGQ